MFYAIGSEGEILLSLIFLLWNRKMAVFLTTSFEGDNNFFIFFPAHFAFFCPRIVKGNGYIFGQSLKKCPANSEGYTT